MSDARSTEREKKALETIRSRLRMVGQSARLDGIALLSLIAGETETGSHETKAKIPSKFLDREVQSVDSHQTLSWKEFPKWLQQQLDCSNKEGNREDTFNHLLKVLQEKPTEYNLRLALAVLNEIGRFPDGGVFLEKRLPQKLIDRFLAKEARQ